MSRENKKIVVIGGGTGVFTVLSGLKNYFKDLTAVVTMADDGGSTGILREEFGILPPGDVRRALIALSKSDNKVLSELFNYRFHEGSGLRGHNFGNLMLTALERITGNFEKAIEHSGKILSAEGKVIPVTLSSVRLVAELDNGEVIRGETNIDIPKHDGRIKIKKVRLSPIADINPAARAAIMKADAVIIGPGDLYTSLVPNLLVHGMKDALKKTKGKVIYFVNLMTKFGETNGFGASDFYKNIEPYVGEKIIDYVIVNGKRPKPERLKPYVMEMAEFVEIDRDADVWKIGKPILVVSDLVRPRGMIRHDSEKVAKIIQKLL